MSRPSSSATTILTAALILCGSSWNGMAAGDAGFFEKKIRPVLASHCFECHSGETHESGLRVDSLNGLLTGGERGPAIVPGKPDESLLISAIRHSDTLQMPATRKLPQPLIDDLAQWVREGAVWPNAEPVTVAPMPAAQERMPTDSERQFWAFQAPLRSPIPQVHDVHNWVRTPLDHFILEQLESRQLLPNRMADRRTLIRRATLALIGLPPTPEEVRAFLADESPTAFESVVERLLSSPRYGERWGRHWLDVVRYADSNGLDENLAFGNAWRYRDYVIDAFNSDLPYDEFLREQLAGDLLPAAASEDIQVRRIIATGFLSLGAKMLAEDDPVKMEMDIIDEQIDTLGKAVLGMTIGCARCHDHKFDPISAHDYYALAGIFKSTKIMDNFGVVARWQERPLARPDVIAERDRQRAAAEAVQAELVQRMQQETDRITDEEVVAELKSLREKKAAIEATIPALAEAMSVSEGSPQNLRIHLRGSHTTLGVEVPRRMPRVFAMGDESPIADGTSGRLKLAEWLTRPSHPLTARVLVNRVWQAHFGEGLVRSPDNFGRLGEKPSHPELLDWLAIKFVDDGWSMKSLHRLILNSAVWQQTTDFNQAAAAMDPENRLLWRMNRRRLEAEAIRDSLLAIGGGLNTTMGGTLLPTENRKYVTSTANINVDVYEAPRRTIYLPVVRSALNDYLTAFDFGDPSSMSGQRDRTTVAPQSLFLMNSRLVASQSKNLATSLLASTADDAGRIAEAFERFYSRPATPSEVESSLGFIASYEDTLRSRGTAAEQLRAQAWQAFCRALMATNEFLYVN